MVELDTSDASKKTPDHPQQNLDSGTATSSRPTPSTNAPAPAKNSFDAMIQHSLDRHGDSSGGEQHAPLSDQVINQPSSRWNAEARDNAIKGNLAQGVASVTNREFQVNGREIQGPVSHNRDGKEFLIDQKEGTKYRIMPPDSNSPNGYLQPVGRNGDHTPLVVESVKTVGGFGDGSNRSTMEGRPPGDKPKPDQVATKPDQVATKPDQVATKPDQVATKPDQVATKPDQVGTKPDQVATKPDQGTPKPDHVTKPADPTAKTPDTTTIKPEAPKVSDPTKQHTDQVPAAPAKTPDSPAVKPATDAGATPPPAVRAADGAKVGDVNSTQGQGQGQGDRSRGQGQGDVPGQGQGDRNRGQGQAQGQGEGQGQGQRQGRQDGQPQGQGDGQGQGQRQGRQDGQPQGQGQPQTQVPGDGNRGDSKTGQISATDARSNQLNQIMANLPPAEAQRLAQALQNRSDQPASNNPGQPAHSDGPTQGQKFTPEQLAALAQNAGRTAGDGANGPGGVNRGQPGDGNQRPVGDGRAAGDGKGTDVGGKPADPAKAGLDVGRLAAEGQTKPGDFNQRQQNSNESLNNPAVRQQFLDLLNQMHAGTLHGDQNSAQAKSLQDLSKALGPEGLAQLRLNLQDGTAVQNLKFDGRDAASQQRIRDIIENVVNPLRRPEGEQATTAAPAKFNMEQFLATLNTTDKTGLAGTNAANSASRITDNDTTRGVLSDLGKALRDFNAVNNPTGEIGKNVSMRDILSRGLDDGKPSQMTAADRLNTTAADRLNTTAADRLNSTAGDRLNPTERKDFILNQSTTDDSLTKALMDRLNAKNQLQNVDGDARKSDIVVRNETMTSRLENRELNINLKNEDAARNNLKPETEAQRAQNQRTIEGALDARQNDKPDPLTQKQLADEREANKHKEEEKPRRKEDDKKPTQPEIDAVAAAALLGKKNKNPNEADTKESLAEKNKKEEEKRQKYVIKPGDTLESIAGKMLRDQRLAGLIFDINQAVIPVRLVNGKKVPELPPRLVIWLPTPTEVRDYRVRLVNRKTPAAEQPKFASAEDELAAKFGTGWDGNPEVASTSGSIEDMEDAARAAYQARRAHIESLLGPLSPKSVEPSAPKYVVRLGDSLKSVAVKHPSLQDVALWKLVAELNRLSTKTDEKGSPLANLRRGQTLIMPTVEEIAAFRKRESGEGPATRQVGLDLPTKPCSGCKRVTFASASICPGCGAVFGDAPNTVAEGKTAVSKPGSGKPTSTKTKMASRKTAERELAKASAQNENGGTTDLSTTTIIEHLKQSATVTDKKSPPLTLSKQLETTARIMQSGTADELATGYRLVLEFDSGSAWIPVVAYEIFEEVSLRHEYKTDGQRKTIRIDLPPEAAADLAANDINSNWRTYCDKFARSLAPS